MFSDNLQTVFQKKKKTFTQKSSEKIVSNKSEACFQTIFKRSFKQNKTKHLHTKALKDLFLTNLRHVFNKSETCFQQI